MRAGKNVKVKKWRRQDILRFRADTRKLILGSIGTPLDHLSVKTCNMHISITEIISWGGNFWTKLI